ncbi:MAG: T9SS type A sorting domain-containing protein [Bacteroidia bacterium]|nr:T9SS type A sorting domain-containing protein [Bacteroidia bacterium]
MIELFKRNQILHSPLVKKGVFLFFLATFMSQVFAQCPAPSGLNVTSVTNSSARVQWTTVSGVVAAYSWWVMDAGETQLIASGVVAGNNATATGLSPSTAYKAFIQTQCTALGTSSVEIGPVSFMTGCAPVGMPFMENLSGVSPPALPSCWKATNLVANNNLNWETSNPTGTNPRFSLSKWTMNDWLWTGAITLEAGVPYEISFKYSGNNGTGGNLKLYRGTSPNASDMNATTLANITVTTQNDALSSSTFTPTTSGVYYFGWLATRTSTASVMTMSLDDISVRPQGCINAPVVNPISVVGTNTATATWTNIAGTSGYEWKMVLTGSGSGASSVTSGEVSANVTTVTATGLNPGIGYDFYLRSACGSGNYSSWSNPVTVYLAPAAQFLASTNNDAYIQLDWTLPVDPCLLSAGTPYSQGVYLTLSNQANSQMIHTVNIPNMSDYVGAQQPVFNAVVNGSNGSSYTINSGINGGQDVTYWTMETWVKHNNGMSNGVIFKNEHTGINDVSLQFLNAQQLQVILGGTPYTFPVGNPAAIPAGRWVHIAVVSNGSKLMLYADGEFKSEVSVTPGSATLKNGAGYSYKMIDNYSNGQVGEIRLWRRVRNQTEIANSRFLTTISNVAQNDLALWFTWNTVSATAAATDAATIADGAANTTGTTMAAVAYSATPNYTPVTGSYKHFVGPGQSRSYTLTMHQIGSGAPATSCNLFSATGSTTAFSPPVQVTATDNGLKEVTVSWKNKSRLSEEIKIYRNGVQIASVGGTTEIDSVMTYTDAFRAEDSMSLVSGTSYNYCIETHSNTLQYTAPTQVCDMGGTLNVNFSASDNAFPDRVALSWNNLSAYGYPIQIVRDGTTIASLSAGTTSFTDQNPVYGKSSQYKLVLQESTNTVLEVVDTGSVAPRGAISGRITTNDGGFAVRGAKVFLSTPSDSTYRDTAITDINGYYSFTGIYYGIDRNFVLNANYANHDFYNNPKTVNLTDAMFNKQNTDFKDSTGFIVSQTPLGVTGFVAIPQSTQNRVNMVWNYPTSGGNDTTVFDIYRENVLIGTTNNIANALGASYTFNDLSGMPGANYIYSLKGYKLLNGVVTTKTLLDTLMFPVVGAPASLSATQSLNRVTLTWVSTLTNIDGYNLYRNGVKIATLGVSPLTYTDLTATPNMTNAYELKARKMVNQVTYESAGVTTSIALPALPVVSALTATVPAGRNSIRLGWTNPASLSNAAFNFDGYRVYRNNTLIGVLPKGIPLFAFEDKTVLPGSYAYSVRPFTNLSDSSFAEANPVNVNAVLPAIASPTGLTATKTSSGNAISGEVRLSWTPLNATATVRNIDGQVLTVANGAAFDTLAYLNPRVSSYRHFTNNAFTRSYYLRAYREINGVKVFSTSSSSASGNAAPGVNTPILPTNFSASTTLSNQVRLSWDYPEYALSRFRIYRDSILLATLETEARSFQDTGVSDWAMHLYQVEAVYGANTSQRAGALGQARSHKMLSGRVYSSNGQYGLPKIDIYVQATAFFARAITDSTGYYQVGVPAQPGITYTVMADAYNNGITQTLSNYNNTNLAAQQTFMVNAVDDKYSVNFTSTYTPEILNTDAPSEVVVVKATPDAAQYRMAITWSLANNDFEGAEIYRGIVKIGTVLNGSPYIFWDEEGAPGIEYFYQVRTYKTVNGQKVYSPYSFTNATMPVLEAPVYLTAVPMGNALRLEWAHKWDNHTSYTVERNGNPVATLNAGDALIYEDFDGLPAQQYRYTVTAIRKIGTAFYYSQPAELLLSFPEIKDVSDFTATVPTTTVTNPTTCSGTINRAQNHVNLSWTYPSANADGYLVYRDENIIANLPKDSLGFKDYTAFPDVQYTYKVQAYLNHDGVAYNANGVSAAPLIFPTLAQPYNATQKDTIGMIRLRWVYAEQGARGFLVNITQGSTVIDQDTVAFSSAINGVLTYWHKDGVPGVNYTYSVQAYSYREGTNFFSALCNCFSPTSAGAVTYPVPATPLTAAATDGTYESYVKVTWNYSSLAEVNGFEIYRDGTKVGEAEKGAREFNHLIFSTSGNYTLRAYREINATRYYSAYSAGDNGYSAPLQNSIQGVAASSFGASTDAYQNMVLVGAPALSNMNGAIHLYQLDANAKIQHVFTKEDTRPGAGGANEFGYDVALAGDMMISVSPWSFSNEKCYVAKLPNPIGVPTYEAYFQPAFANGERPKSVGISDLSVSTNSLGIVNTHPVLFGFPEFNANAGGVNLQVYGNGSNWQTGAIPNGRFGQEVAANQRHFVIARPGGTSTDNLFEYYLFDPSIGSIGLVGALPYPNGIAFAANLGVSMAYSADYDLAAGAPDDNGGGKVYVYHRNNILSDMYPPFGTNPSPWSVPVAIPNPSGMPGDKFGSSIDINGKWLLASAPSAPNGGKAYLYYKGSNNQWNLIQTYPFGGATVSLGNHHAFIGSSSANKLYIEPLGDVDTVYATQGTINGQTRIDWIFTGVDEEIGGFRVFRDGILIGTASKTDRLYFDATGIPGKKYIYEVAVYHSDMEQRRYPSEGWSRPDGQIEGKVLTTASSAGVGGVKLTATAFIDNNYFIYEATTDGSGNYIIPNMYYGSGNATYSVTAEYRTHEFLENPVTASINASNPTAQSVNFFDKSSYIIKGNIARKDVSCGLDSIQVMPFYVYNDGSRDTINSVYTDKEGNYSVVVDPFKLNLYSVVLRVPNTRTVTFNTQTKTEKYQFAPQGDTAFVITPSFAESNTLDFLDTLTYVVPVQLTNACSTPILGGKYKIRVKDSKGCYSKVFETDLNGGATLKIPALDVMINVEDVVNLNTQTELVVNYLRYRPQALKLSKLHIENDLYAQTQTVRDDSTKRTFVYFTPPIVSVKSGFTNKICEGTPQEFAVVEQGKTYWLRFGAESNYNGVLCSNKTGKLIIRNAAAVAKDTTILFNVLTDQFNLYRFQAGDPNLVSPHKYTMTVEYRSNEDELLGIKTFAVLVEGTAPLPGNDIVVELGSADQIKLPMYVVHKPYGDNSSASIEAGTSVSYEFGESYENVGNGGVGGEFSFSLGIGWKFEIEQVWGKTNATNKLDAVTFSTSTGISTTTDSGEDTGEGDVIVGTGIAAQYGLAQTIKAVNCDSTAKIMSIQFSPNSVQTSWMYTMQHIEHLLEGYQEQLKQIDAGTLVLRGKDNQILPKQQAKDKVNGYINGWEQIKLYHRKQTLPYYDLCSHEVSTKVSQKRRAEIVKWKEGYCTGEFAKIKDGQITKSQKEKIEGYDTDEFVKATYSIKDVANKDTIPADKFRPWDENTLWAYNVARTAIYHLEHVYPYMDDGKYAVGWSYNNKNSNNYSDAEFPWFVKNWEYKSDALKLNNNSGKAILDTASRLGLLGLPAKNITFSNGVEYSESQENVHATTFARDESFTGEGEFKFGPFFKVDVAAGFGWSVGVTEAENWPYFKASWAYTQTASRSSTKERANTTSFTLADDDEFDQFSVTVIQGVHPGHTPSFELVGGRSSCPYEPGTIARDNPSIAIWDDASSSVSQTQTLYNVKENETANYKIQISNNSPFGEFREVTVFQLLNTNTENAEVRLSGQLLGEGLTYFLPPNEPIILTVSVAKGVLDFDVTDLRIGIKASCTEMKDAFMDTARMVVLNAYWDSPCSDIVLLTPESNWQIKRRNPLDPNSREQLLIKMADYDPENTKLKSVRLEYRRFGSNQDWVTIDGSEIEKDSLKTWNSLNFLPGAVPYYPVNWDITDNYTGFPDGTYEIRAVAECETAGRVATPPVRGTIYRNTTLLGNPEPADRIWTNGDEISVSYIRDIDCPALAASFIVRDSTQHLNVPGTVLCNNNKVTFLPSGSMKPYHGDSLYMMVNNVKDIQGNIMNPVTWSFKVFSADLYVADEWIELLVEKGNEATVSSSFINNTATGEPLSYQIQGLSTYSSWLSTENESGSVIQGMPEMVSFKINSAVMPIDTVEAKLDVSANGTTYQDILKIRVIVIPKSPNWQVNEDAYEQTMTLISNFNFNNTGIKSTDTTDIISVWIDNQPRGVAKISQITPTIYNAVIAVYGNPADAAKPLAFRVWDASAGKEYDARPDANATVTFAANKITGTLSNPLFLDVITTSDEARYIPLNAGWTMFSANTELWNRPVNTALSSLKHKSTGDVIKTANKSASYTGTAWVSANGLDSTNVHRGYSIYLQNPDTLRITGAAATIRPISLNQGWNFIGYPLQGQRRIDSAMVFLGTPDTMWLKTVAQNPAYSDNMVANYYGGSWKFAPSSDMLKLRPYFAYWLKVNTSGSQLRYPGVITSPPVSLLRIGNTGSEAHPEEPETWGINPADYESNMLVNAVVNIDKRIVRDTATKVAAFVDGQIRGFGQLTYVPELNEYFVSMMVYSNEPEEEVEFRIFNGENSLVYHHYEPLVFTADDIKGSFEAPYRFSNIAPDNAFSVSAYPNPFETRFKVQIQADKAQQFTVSLLDVAGRTILTEEATDEVQSINLTIDTEKYRLTNGVYFLKVNGSLGESYTVKLVK